MTPGIQLGLWPDVRVPDEFLDAFKTSGRCPHCKRPLRHPAHAQRHWRQCHTRTSKTATLPLLYFVWNAAAWRWKPVTRPVYLQCRAAGFTVTSTRGEDLSSAAV